MGRDITVFVQMYDFNDNTWYFIDPKGYIVKKFTQQVSHLCSQNYHMFARISEYKNTYYDSGECLSPRGCPHDIDESSEFYHYINQPYCENLTWITSTDLLALKDPRDPDLLCHLEQIFVTVNCHYPGSQFRMIMYFSS